MQSMRCPWPYLFTSCVSDRFEKIAVAVVALNDPAVLVADALNNGRNTALQRLDVETSRRAHGHAARVDAGLQTFGHIGTHHVACAKAMDALAAHQVAPGEAEFVQARALVAAAAHGFQAQRWAAPAFDAMDLADASGIQRVGLGDAQRASVELGPPAGGELHRQAPGLQGIGQRPTRGINGRRVAQRPLGLGRNGAQPLGVLGQEVFDAARALFLVAAGAGQRQVGGAVAAAQGLGLNVFNLQREILGAAVGALALPFLQQVLAQLVAKQRALLVLDAIDFRVLQRLRVKAHELRADGAHRCPALQALDPGHGRVHAVLKRRRQPARFFVSTIEKSWRAKAQIAPAPTAHLAARRQGLGNLSATVDQLHQVENSHTVLDFSGQNVHCLCLANERQPRGFAARVDFEAKRLKLAGGGLAVNEADDHGHEAVHARPAAIEQQPGALFGARHQGLAIAVQHKNRHVRS